MSALVALLAELDDVRLRAGGAVVRCPGCGSDAGVTVRAQDGHPVLSCAGTAPCDGEVVRGKLQALGDGLRPYVHNSAYGHEGWPRPLSLETGPRPEFPVADLPSEMLEFVSAVAAAMQVPIALPALLALSSIATLAQGRLWLAVEPGWIEPLCIWTMTLMPPGSRKSPVFRTVTEPLRAIERALREAAEPEMLRRQHMADVEEARLKALKAAAAKATDEASRQAADADLQAAVDRAAPVEPLEPPRLIATDVTPEALTSLLAAHGSLAVLDAEGGFLTTMLGRYSSGVANLDVPLKAWAGDSATVDRIGRAAETLPNPRLTVGLAVQEDVLALAGTRRESRGTGLLARFLYAVPEPTVGSRAVEAPPVPEEVRSAWASLLAGIAMMPFAPDFGTPAMQLGPDAVELHRAFRAALEPRLHPHFGDLAAMADWASKLPGTVARVCRPALIGRAKSRTWS